MFGIIWRGGGGGGVCAAVTSPSFMAGSHQFPVLTNCPICSDVAASSRSADPCSMAPSTCEDFCPYGPIPSPVPALMVAHPHKNKSPPSPLPPPPPPPAIVLVGNLLCWEWLHRRASGSKSCCGWSTTADQLTPLPFCPINKEIKKSFIKFSQNTKIKHLQGLKCIKWAIPY